MAQNPNESATIGTVTAIVGEVKVTGTDGVVRTLTAGDTVATGEVIETSANGAVHIQLANGRALECGPRFSGTLNPGLLDLASGTRIALDGSIINPAVAAVPAPGDIATPAAPGTTAIPQDIAALQAAIAGGADPSQIAQASAAGGAAPGAGGADGGGGTPLLIEQANSQGQVTSGIDGGGGKPLGFPDLTTTQQTAAVQPEGPPLTPPVISVDITGIRLVPPTEEPETPIPENIVVSGNIVSLVEGTSPGVDPGKILNFVLVLNKASDVDITVNYTITAQGEDGDVDLVDLLGGTVTIPAGTTQILVPIKISQDHSVEIDESFELVITSATNANINPDASTAILKIINDDEPPLARDDAYTVNESENGTTLLPSVLTRTESGETVDDSGADAGETLVVTSTGTIATTQGGQVQMNADGTFHYFAPNAEFNGTDSFSYTMTDGFNGESQAVVTITVAAVDDLPNAVDNAYSVNEDTVLTIALPGVLAGDTTGGDGGVLAVTGYTQPAHGTLTLDANGGFVYTPVANYNGPDSFTYTIQDADGDTDTATVAITVNPVNDLPNAVDNAYSVNEDTVLTIALPGVLAGDTTGGDGGVLAVTGYTQPAHGTLTLDPNGGFVYTPAANYNGPDSFTYTIQDADGDTDTATVAITVNPVNDLPNAVDNAYSVNEDTVLTIALPGVLAGDTTGGDGGVLAVTGYTQPAHGTLTLDPNGGFVYTPAANYNGPDSFTYTIQDADGDTDTATVAITVNPVDEVPSVNIPVAGGATTTVYEEALPARGSEPAGSNSLADTETVAGTITFTSPDGLSLVSLGGHALTGTAQTFSDGLTASYTYNVATGAGTINYSYTLADNTSSNNTVASFPVVVTDTDGDSAPAGNLVINIVDDTPAIISIANIAAQNNAGIYTGSWVPVTGADGYNANVAAPNVSSAEGINITLTNPPALVKGSNTEDKFDGVGNYVGEQYTAYFDAAKTQVFFTLLMKTNGTYEFNLIEPNPTVTTTETLNLTGSVGGFGDFLYAEKIADAKHYPDPKTDIKFIAHQDYAGGTDLGVPSNVNTSNNGIGVSDSGSGGGIHTALNESLTLTFLKGDADTDGDTHPADSAAQPIDSVKVSFQVAHDNGKDSVNDEVSVRFILHLADGSTETQNAPGTGIADNGSYTVASTSGTKLLSVDVVNVDTDGDTFLLTAADVTVTTTQLPSDLTLNFSAQIVDGDGDVSATVAFTVAMDTNNSMSSTPGDTNDIMYGDAVASDTFVWHAGDTGTDTVVNFATGPAQDLSGTGDTLDLADILQGESADSASLVSFLSFSSNGTDTTISIDADGALNGQSNTQTIVLKGLDLTAGGTMDATAIINQLLTDHNLKTS